jgi:ABC-type dipeptide/oligopeptide/nickel transport system permease subunit
MPRVIRAFATTEIDPLTRREEMDASVKTANARAPTSVVRPLERYPLLRQLNSMLGKLMQDKVALAAAAYLMLLLIAAVFAPYVAPHDPTEQDLAHRLWPPAWTEKGTANHLLGTDQLGRDILSRMIHGSRISLVVGVFVVLVAGGVGTVVGLVSGFYGGRIDNVLMRLVDLQTAFPGLLVALAIITMIGPSVRNIIIVLSINGWMVYARMIRGTALGLRNSLFVDAARSIGARNGRIIFLHMLPNLASPLITLATLELARIILAEAVLSFLGMGIQPPASSWGLMINEGHPYITMAWWLVTFPGAAIALTVLSVNLVATWLRAISDPMQRQKQFGPRLR